jgi:tripartite-type tricarboxylate transporter receptor subunit TctC
MQKILVAAGMLAWLGLSTAMAAYPDRPIRFIVSSAAGGTPDTTARIFAAELTKQLGQQVVVDNRPGAGSVIGTMLMAKAAPDGYTMGYGTIGPIAIQRSVQANLPYDPDRELQAVVQIAATPNLLAVSKSLPVTTVKGLIDYARASPEKLLYASTGSGASQHLTGELFKYMAGIQMTHIPFKAATLALTDVISGRVHLMFENIGSVGQHVKSGKLQGVAVTSGKRVGAFADLPTVAEAGVPGFESVSWGGIVVPAGAPQAIVARLNREINAAMALPHVKEKYAAFGSDLVGGTPEQFTAQIRKDTVKWADVVKRAGVKAD